MKFDSQETRRVPLLYGIDILTDDYFRLVTITHLTDRWTNRQKTIERAQGNRVRCALKAMHLIVSRTGQSTHHPPPPCASATGSY